MIYFITIEVRKLDGTFLTILIIIVISIGVFALIKKVCKPIKTVTAILLIIPTVATCGIVLFIYKFFRNSFEITSYHEKNSSSATNAHQITSYDIPTFDEPKKTEKKKPARAFTDVSGKTAYYDDEGNLIGSSTDNGFGEKVFTDAEGNYTGEGFSNGLGQTVYTDKDGNITSSNTNYRGDEAFSDGTTAKKDSFGNTFYS